MIVRTQFMARQFRLLVLSLSVVALTLIAPAHANNFKPDGTFSNDIDTLAILTYIDDDLVEAQKPDEGSLLENIQLKPNTKINFGLLVRADQADTSATSVKGRLTFRPFNPAHTRMTWTVKLADKQNFCNVTAPCDYFYKYFYITPKETGTWVFAYDGWPTTKEPQYVSQTIEILNPSPRNSTDAPDATSGYQVHAVYVVPSDGIDANRDINGDIGNWLDQSTALLDRGFGRHWNWDKRKDGRYDISFFRSKQKADDLKPTYTSVENLISEYAPMRTLGVNRKTYIFLTEGTGTETACGRAQVISARAALVSVRDYGCAGATDEMQLPDYRSSTIVHEVLHTLGVKHVNDKQDLMCGDPYPCDEPYDNLYVDPDHRYYNGTTLRGLDVQKQRIWSSNPMDQRQEWTCPHTESELQARHLVICAGGSNIVPLDLVSESVCVLGSWKGNLQTLVAGKWKNAGTLTNYAFDACAENTDGYTHSLRASVKGKAGTKAKYRFNGGDWHSPSFTVVFLN